jgi:UPF0755 protein
MYNHQYGSRRRLPRRILWVASTLAVLLVTAVALIRTAYNQALQPVSSSQKVTVLTVKTGSTSIEIADQLHHQGLIRSSGMFQWYIRTKNVRDKLQAGTYALRPSMSVQEIVTVMVDGSVKSDLVTILPGQRLDQVRQALINAGFMPAAVDAALQPEQYAGHIALADKPAGASLEGFLYPDSYQKTAATDPSTIVNKALDQMAVHLTPAVRAAFAAQGLSVYQGVTLASIVEKEVSNPADSPKVAQVFLKRLKVGMPLGSDVTVLYGAIVAGKEPSLAYQSAYNTHDNKGLPPGPISNVSDVSLQAVAKPAPTDWLFFVAGDDGTTYFSNTIQEHEALTGKYCKKLCAATPQ